VRFDERGQAVWEWQLKTGHFSSNATSSKLRALTNTALSIEESSAKKPLSIDKEAGINPYETIQPPGKGGAPEPPAGGQGKNPYGTTDDGRPKDEPKGADPYSRGPTKNPNTVSYNPYERPKPKKPAG